MRNPIKKEEGGRRSFRNVLDKKFFHKYHRNKPYMRVNPEKILKLVQQDTIRYCVISGWWWGIEYRSAQ